MDREYRFIWNRWQLLFGSSASGLTSAQLAKISFTGFNGTPILLSTGELVPDTAELVQKVKGTLSALSTVYGTASSISSFSVYGNQVRPNLVVTPPIWV